MSGLHLWETGQLKRTVQKWTAENCVVHVKEGGWESHQLSLTAWPEQPLHAGCWAFSQQQEKHGMAWGVGQFGIGGRAHCVSWRQGPWMLAKARWWRTYISIHHGLPLKLKWYLRCHPIPRSLLVLTVTFATRWPGSQVLLISENLSAPIRALSLCWAPHRMEQIWWPCFWGPRTKSAGWNCQPWARVFMFVATSRCYRSSAARTIDLWGFLQRLLTVLGWHRRCFPLLWLTWMGPKVMEPGVEF